MSESSNNLEKEWIIVCSKGDMLLEKHNITKEFQLSYSMCNLKKLNLNEFLSFKIYDLLKKLNLDLIEDIKIINTNGESEINLLFIFQNITKEFGLKQKAMFLNVVKEVSFSEQEKHKVIYNAKTPDSNIDNYELYNKKFSLLNCEFAKTIIDIKGSNIDMIYNFKILTKEDLPIYMENIIGLMMKKIFYNLKKFVDKLENN